MSRPEKTLERIASGMRESLSLHRDRIDTELYKQQAAEWDAGMMSVEPARVFVPKNAPAQDPSGTPGTGPQST